MSASCSLELTNSVIRSLDKNFSLTKWQSISTCIVLSWNIELETIWRELFDCHNTTPSAYFHKNFNSWRSCLIHTSSHVARAIDRYSVFALVHEITLCFFLFQDTRFPSSNTQYLVIEHLSIGQLAQSTSYYPTTWVLSLFSHQSLS